MKRLLFVAACLFAAMTARAGFFETARPYVSASFGEWVFEADAPVRPGPFASVLFGVDGEDSWSFETGVLFAPALRTDGPDAWLLSVHTDAVFHCTPYDRWDPYGLVGLGLAVAEKNRTPDDVSFVGRFGLGMFRHVNDRLSLRIDSIVEVGGSHCDFDWTLGIGAVFRF